jgi:hypothetical protein
MSIAMPLELDQLPPDEKCAEGGGVGAVIGEL